MSYTHFGRSLDEIIDLEDWDTELLNAHFAVQQIMENFSGNLIKVQFIVFFEILISILRYIISYKTPMKTTSNIS